MVTARRAPTPHLTATKLCGPGGSRRPATAPASPAQPCLTAAALSGNQTLQRCRLLQIWIEPSEDGLTPSYEQRAVHLRANDWTPVLDPQDPEAMTIQRPVHLWRAQVAKGKTLELPSVEASHCWLQVIAGDIELKTLSGSNTLGKGDGLGFRSRPPGLQSLESRCDQSDLLLFALN